MERLRSTVAWLLAERAVMVSRASPALKCDTRVHMPLMLCTPV